MRDWLWPLAVAVVVALIWLGYYERWTVASWRVPLDYSGDSLEMLARIRLVMDGEIGPMHNEDIQRLGAPLGTDWTAYPASDKWLLQLCGWVARSIGLMETANLALLLAHVTSALSFYFCARQLRYPRVWVAVGAVLYANLYLMFARGLPHLLLVFSWTVPCVLLVAWWLARSRRLRRRWVVVVLVAAGLGVSNPYNLFFGLQLWGWSLVAQWFGRRRVENFAVGAGAILVAVVAFGVSNASYFTHAWQDEMRPVLARNYGGTEQFALKPIELIIPPPDHRFGAGAALGKRYLRWSEWRGEAFSPYLGVVGATGLAWLLGAALVALLKGRNARVPGMALQAGWVLGFASVGGITNVMSFFLGLHVFRATNRFSVFLAALALLFLVGQLSRMSIRRRWPAWASAGVAFLLLAVGLYDQVPRMAKRDRAELIQREWQSDLAFGRELEKRLPPGATVFQLPVLLFPEGPTPGRMRAYGHFRPYLVTDTLRFSYGALKYRPRQQWQLDLEQLPPAELVQELERLGFAALYLNRRAYPDSGAGLIQSLGELGYTDKIPSELGGQIVVLLRPSANPEMPLARAPTPGAGWYFTPEDDQAEQRWAYGPASLVYHNPFDRPLAVRAAVTVSAPARRKLTITLNEVVLQTAPLDDAPHRIDLGTILLAPGRNTLRLTSNRAPLRLSDERFGLRDFSLHGIEWVIDEQAGAQGR